MFAATPAGFKNAPVTRALVAFIVGSSLVSSIVGIKHYLFLQLVPHVWGWGQWWRLFSWEFVYLNESEVLFASLMLYNLRVIERLLGSRKFASLIVVSYGYTSVLSPLFLLMLKITPGYSANYLPSGPTSTIFSMLALYHDLIPSVYKFRIASGQEDSSSPHAITLSDKIFVYVISTQLAFSQSPGSLICAFTGWIIGVLWTREVLPGRNWRVPDWWQRKRSVDVTAARTSTPAQPPNATRTTEPVAAGRELGNQILDTFRANF
ncbi:hypothetical protein V1512DRAFT_266455 [Lipomyces arxii]|uniref:uncharacterized protein n=1 Tax=Lipomyces arxii TaxID=56418 RepID=UPI0034CE216C